MAAIRKQAVDQFEISFAELARARRGDPVQIDPYLIARAIALVMGECTVRSAAGRSILWNEYRMILARRDFDQIRALQGPLERDLRTVLAQEAAARAAELVGELRVTVVFDDSDELPAGRGVVRTAFLPTERLPAVVAGEMTVRLDSWRIAGEIAAKVPPPPPPATETVIVTDSGDATGYLLEWSGGRARIPLGTRVTAGRPYAGATPEHVALTGADAKVSKEHVWIGVGAASARIARPPKANPVHVNGRLIAAGQEVEVAPPAEISLSHGALVLVLRRE
jgi:hypothetical protein